MKDKPIVPIAIFIIFIFGVSISNHLKKDVSFSQFENRPLAQFPKFSVERLLNGRFTEQFETYMTDQFIGKTFWTGIKAKAEQSLFKQENNGVYFGKNEYLFEKPKPLTKQLASNIDALNQFQEKNVQFPLSLLLAPTSIDLYPEKLPAYAQTGMHEQIIDIVTKELTSDILVIDPVTQLQKVRNQYIYFRTDHHWTMEGALYAYKQYMKETGQEAYDDFQIKKVSNKFHGTFYVKGNDLFIPPDEIDVFIPKNRVQYKLQADNGYELDGLYDESFLEKRDQYSYFLGGNHAKTIIKSSVRNGKRLLLLKDSYAHAIVPFLANHFEEIHMIDLRYYNASISQYITDFNLTEGLILYNSPNFAADSSLLYLKY